MKLLYVWVKNYKDFILDQEYSFSPEYEIRFDRINRITIKNEKYIKDFYGKNILEITAIVGENGSGKTTLARMLHSKCNSVQPFGDIIQNYNESKKDFNNDYSKEIQVYVNKYHENGFNKEEFVIYYFLGNEVILEVEPNNYKYSCFSLNGLKNDSNGNLELTRAEEKHKIAVVYFTNAFDINHISKEDAFTESKIGHIDKSIVYSPAYNLRKAKSENNDLYGIDHMIGRGMLLYPIIKEYTERMNLDYFEAYKKYQAYDFLLVFKNAPTKIKKRLPFFQEFDVSVKIFAYYVEYDETIAGTDKNFDNIMHFIFSNITSELYKNIDFESSIIKNVFINVLCETILFLDVWDQPDAFKILNDNNLILMSDKGAFDLVLDNIKRQNPSKTKTIELIKKAKLTTSLDISILKEFQQLIIKEYQHLLETYWYVEFSDYIKEFDNNIELQLFNRISFHDVEIIDFLFKEFEKKISVYKRMLNIDPISSSTGETALANIFASLYRTIEIKETCDDIILILDELDIYLHPRWQQKILKDIIEWINYGFKDKKIQLIITSHSPIILSDITSERVIKLKKNAKNHCVICSSTENTFGANISTLFYDSFFMENGSIGEIAKEKIVQVINYINEHDNKIISYEEVEYIINNIGEPIVKQKLLADLKLKALREQNPLEQISQIFNKLSKEDINKVKDLIKNKGGEAID